MDCRISHITSPDNFYAQIGNAKIFGDLQKLIDLIQTYCGTRKTHFHSPGNVEEGEIVFIKSVNKDGIYVRAKVIVTNAESCSALLIDYGPVEENITFVLKIDPSVKKFAEIPACASKYSLAFVKPIGGEWSAEATELLREHCKDQLIYLPTEDPSLITLIARQENSAQAIIDLSVILIQAGHARRIAGNDESVPPSLAASICDASQHPHLAAIPIDLQTSVTSSTLSTVVKPPPGFPVQPPPGFDVKVIGAGDSAQNPSTEPFIKPVNGESEWKNRNIKPRNVYVPPALRDGSRNLAGRYNILKLSHALGCVCLICTIRNTFEMESLSHAERLETVLAVQWPQLTSKEEAILRCSITGTQLTSEDRELLLNIMLGITKQQMTLMAEIEQTRKKSLDSATQVTSSLNRLTLGSYDVSDDSSSGKSSGVIDEITIMRHSTDLSPESGPSNSLPSNHDNASVSPSPPAPVAYLPVEDDPENWSDPEDKFFYSSDSDPDCVLESCASTSANTEAAPSIATSQSTDVDWSKQTIDATNSSQSNADHPSMPMANSDYQPRTLNRLIIRGASRPAMSRFNSRPMRNASGPRMRNSNTSPSKNSGTSNNKTTLISYGLGLSAAQPADESTKPKYMFHSASPTNAPAEENGGVGGFGMIHYCTFCGSTVHGSASCPDGTKNLFLN